MYPIEAVVRLGPGLTPEGFVVLPLRFPSEAAPLLPEGVPHRGQRVVRGRAAAAAAGTTPGRRPRLGLVLQSVASGKTYKWMSRNDKISP